MLDALLFFASVLRWIFAVAAWIVAIIHLKGCINGVMFSYANLEEKQQLQEEYDFVRINRHFGGSFYLSLALWLTFNALGSIFIANYAANPYYWLVYVILAIVWGVCLFRYIYVMITRRWCEQFRRTAQPEQI
ncbi:MAG: hypothetical protein FWG64_00685 [Firmicutes bacterium]|nr:hypothetical protein [Bacillota bacterium]